MKGKCLFLSKVKKFFLHLFIVTFFLSLFGTCKTIASEYGNILPIAMAADDGFVYPTLVSMESIIKNKRKNIFIKFYIMIPGNMSCENKERFENFKNLYKDSCTVELLDMKCNFSSLRSGLGYITYPTCYRLLISSYLPQYDKVIYLDGDILVRHDLWDFYCTDTDDYYLAGVRDFGFVSYDINRSKRAKEKNKNVDSRYVNAGVLITNTKRIREENLESKFLDFLNKKKTLLLDQDALNSVCYGKIKQLNPTYNNMVNFLDSLGKKMPFQFFDCCNDGEWKKIFYDPVIVHYAGGPKPWKTSNVKFYDEWNSYRKEVDNLFYKTINDGVYTIESAVKNNMVLDISNSSRDNEANLQLWESNGTDAQKFNIFYSQEGLYEISPLCSGKRVDVKHSGQMNGTNVWQWEANGTNAQKWYIRSAGDGYYNIISKCNGLCLDVHGAQTEKGTNIWCYSKNRTDAQKFRFKVA